MKKIILIFAISLYSFSVVAQNWMTSFDDAKKLALATNKLILVDFWASWCGPCKQMDRESWSKSDVRDVMSHYVPVKIDIDRNGHLASTFSVRAIPYVFIMDANGKVVFSKLSYMEKKEVLKVLKKYAYGTEFVQRELLSFSKKENFASTLRLSQKYLDFAVFTGEAKKEFLGLTSYYITLSKKHLEKSNPKYKDFKQRLEILGLIRDIYRAKYKKTAKRIKSFTETEIANMNQKYFAYLNYLCCRGLGDNEGETKWKTSLIELNGQKMIKVADKHFETI